MNTPIHNFWKLISDNLRSNLLIGSLGTKNCLNLTTEAFHTVNSLSTQINQPTKPELEIKLITAAQLLLAAWEADPLNGELAGQILCLTATNQNIINKQNITPKFLNLLQAIHRHWKPPENIELLETLFLKGDYAKLAKYLDRQLKEQPINLFWLSQVFNLAFLDNNLSWAETHLRVNLGNDLKALSCYLTACLSLAQGKINQAKVLLKHPIKDFAPDWAKNINDINNFSSNRKTSFANNFNDAFGTSCCFFWSAPIQLLAQTLLLSDAKEQALYLYLKLIQAQPWQTNLILKTHDLLAGNDVVQNNNKTNAISLMLYSYNKATELDKCLQALTPDIPLFSSVSVLNNGSTDDTLTVLKKWQGAFAKKFHLIDLPVNVGAAAARNWLLTRAEVQNSDFCLYLDDDALVRLEQNKNETKNNISKTNNHWLQGLLQAVQLYPKASVWGLKILDYNMPYLAQSVDLHILKNSNDFSLRLAYKKPFQVSFLQHQMPDFGCFDYIRPCLSVTGCCHLFKTKEILEDKGFNLAFSPSQFDDLERDLCMAKQKKYACYQGFASVWHLKSTGKASRMSIAQYGSALGNLYKLHAQFNSESLKELIDFQTKLLKKDLFKKIRVIDEYI